MWPLAHRVGVGNQYCNMFQFHVTVNEGDVEWPEKRMADKGSSLQGLVSPP